MKTTSFAVPEAWQPKSACNYTFYLPTDAVQVPAQGEDSCVAQYSAGACTYFSDSGMFAGGPGTFQDASVETKPIEVGGLPATLTLIGGPDGQYVVHLFVMGKATNASDRLSLAATCQGNDAALDAQIALRSVTLTP